jgi:hypothetical protein
VSQSPQSAVFFGGHIFITKGQKQISARDFCEILFWEKSATK